MADPVFLLNGLWAEISPDGTKIAFSRFSTTDLGADGTGTFQLWVADSDGTDEVCISASIPTKHVGMACWHPSGDWLIVTREMASYTGLHFNAHPGKGVFVNLWAVTPDGVTWHQLTDYATAAVGSPYFAEPIGALQAKFNSSGTKIAWSRKIGVDPEVPTGFAYWDLVIADWVETLGVPSLENQQVFTPGYVGTTFYEVWDWKNDDSEMILATDSNTAAVYMDTQLWRPGFASISNVSGPNLQWDEQAFYSPDESRIALMSSYQQLVPFDAYNLWDTWYSDIWTVDAVPGAQRIQRLTYFNEPGHDMYFARDPGVVVRAIPCQWRDDGTMLIQLVTNTGSTQHHEDSQIWVMVTDGAYVEMPTEITLTLQSDIDDTHIVYVAPTTNYDTSELMAVGDTSAAASLASRILLRFNGIEQIPYNATIKKVTLSLYEAAAYDTVSAGSWQIDVYRVLKDWEASEATWNKATSATSWTTPGAGQDVSATPSASLKVDGIAAAGFVHWSSLALRDDVVDMVRGKGNFGWAIAATDVEFAGVAGLSGNIFASSDNSIPNYRPRLVIVYELVREIDEGAAPSLPSCFSEVSAWAGGFEGWVADELEAVHDRIDAVPVPPVDLCAALPDLNPLGCLVSAYGIDNTQISFAEPGTAPVAGSGVLPSPWDQILPEIVDYRDGIKSFDGIDNASWKPFTVTFSQEVANSNYHVFWVLDDAVACDVQIHSQTTTSFVMAIVGRTSSPSTVRLRWVLLVLSA